MEEHKKEPEREAGSESVTIEFPRESEYVIGNTHFIVTEHFDDTQEDLKEKMARLLKKEVSEMIRPTIPPDEPV